MINATYIHRPLTLSGLPLGAWTSFLFLSAAMAQLLNVTIQVDVLSPAELTPDEALTWQQARAATNNAYAPFSQFHVGAALLLDDGSVFQGNNQENPAYPSGLCAERTAMFGLAVSQPERRIVGMAVAARPKNGDFVVGMPCGACRQVMTDYEVRQGQPIPLLLLGPDDTIYRFRSLADLLPFQFTKENLPPRE